MRNPSLTALASLLSIALSPTAAFAQDDRESAPRPIIPIRSLAGLRASDSTLLMDVANVRHLRTGGVIVNDVKKRQLVVFDSALTRHRIVSDTSSNSPNSYGLRATAGSLLPYVGDSSLFVDTESQALLVINPQGEFVRVMAPVRANDLFYISTLAFGFASWDPQGRLIYRSHRRSPPQAFMGAGSTETRRILIEPDSAPLMRMDFDKRTVDTIGFIKIPIQKMMQISTENMRAMINMMNPLPQSDEWAVLPDGVIAIVRGHDYHVDWMTPDGKYTSSPRMPFDWKRITLEEKQAMIDSVKRVEAERVAKLPPPPPTPPGQPVFPRMQFTPVDATDLPDYYPAVRQGQVRADYEGRLWILPSTSKDAKDGLLYDVVDRAGQIVERVQLPKGRTLVGFAPGGTLYLNHVRGPTKATLERATVARP